MGGEALSKRDYGNKTESAGVGRIKKEKSSLDLVEAPAGERGQEEKTGRPGGIKWTRGGAGVSSNSASGGLPDKPPLRLTGTPQSWGISRLCTSEAIRGRKKTRRFILGYTEKKPYCGLPSQTQRVGGRVGFGGGKTVRSTKEEAEGGMKNGL